MYRLIEGDTGGLADVREFLATLGVLREHPLREARGLFFGGADIFISRAPGRLDVMGGIADYSGSLVLQLPIREATLAAIQAQEDRVLRIVSLSRVAERPTARAVTVHLENFEGDSNPEYETARALFARRPEDHWAAYVAGVFLVLMRERSVQFKNGARILIHSDVPEGKGVSSSAALEVAVMHAVAACYGISVEPREAALLCQKVENLVVGAPCGIMDQMTSACGRANRLLALLCQPAELQDFIPIPDGIGFAGIDSGVRHAVTGAAYSDVRAGAFMGYRIIADRANLLVHAVAKGNVVQISDPHWRGYLANIDPFEYERDFASNIPLELTGFDFLSRYGGTTDPVTRIDGKKAYRIRMPTAHPIYENSRVRAFGELLRGALDEQRFGRLGELMYQSHASYSACGLGEGRTDLLVNLCRQAGGTRGALGAKITGGGSGGTVAILARDAAKTAQEIAAEFKAETGENPYVFTGSSPGAAEFGTLRLRNAD